MGVASPHGLDNLPCMVRLLFICGKARMRSPTAADMATQWFACDTDFAGLSRDADEKVSSEHLQWADQIFVMERRQKKRLTSMFSHHLADKKLAVLDVPDRFEYMQPELVDLLYRRLTPILGSFKQV